MVAAIQLTLGAKIRLSQWGIAADSNAAVMEGSAWLDGRLDLPDQGGDPAHKRMHDTAYFNGKVYNVFPPLVAFLTVLFAPLHQLLIGETDTWLQTIHVFTVFWPLVFVGFIVFRRQVSDSVWAAVLTIAWLGGTSLLPNIAAASTGLLGQLNHVLSQVGLLIFAADLLGNRRIWPALIGLAIAAWTRQMTALYALPLLWVAWEEKKLGRCILGLFVIAAPMMVLNQLKFGSPLDFGYRHIYVGREAEPLARRCLEQGLFSVRFVPENLYYMFIAPPRVDEISLTNVNVNSASLHGTSIWITTPFLVFALISAGWWFRDPLRRVLMLATLPVMLGDLCYHGTGFLQDGYNRFALDFIPIWLVVFAPMTRGGWRTGLMLGCVAWSMLYFQAITPNQAILAEPLGVG